MKNSPDPPIKSFLVPNMTTSGEPKNDDDDVDVNPGGKISAIEDTDLVPLLILKYDATVVDDDDGIWHARDDDDDDGNGNDLR